MARFIPTNPLYITEKGTPKHAPPEDGEWIAVKPRLTRGQRSRLLEALATLGVDAETEKTSVQFNVGEYLNTLLDMTVVDWRLTGEGGELVPFARELIGNLDDDDALVARVIKEVTERNPLSGLLQGMDGSAS